jgi:D-alanyl-D-alanine carboxypeptidase (penicillin-binding protein 5/6)
MYRRRRITVASALALLLGVGFYLPFTLLAPVQAASAQLEPWQAPAVSEPAIAFPGYGASGVGAVGYSGVLARAGSTGPLPIASITKVVTALVVLSVKPLAGTDAGPNLTFGPADDQFYADQVAQNGVVEPVSDGETMPQRTVMTVMLMASANNYADSLANWAFGSKDAYVAAARTWLDKHGLTTTTIVDPTGIQPSNTSTITDLVELARLAVADPVISQIVATTTVDVPGIGTVTNRNELLGIDGVNGIKTGTLDESGACLLFSATVTVGGTPITLIGAVLGGPDHPTVDGAVRTLLAQATAGFHEVSLVKSGASFASYSTPWGDAADAVTASPASLLLWQNTPVTATVRAEPVKLAAIGTEVGEVTFTAGEQSTKVALVLSHAITDPGAWWRLTHPGRLS